MKREILLATAVVLASVLGTITLMATAPSLEPSASTPKPLAVRSMTVEAKLTRLTVNSQGSVMPNTETDLIPEVAGRVVEVSPSLVAGGYFAKGDVLLRMDDADHRATESRAASMVTQAKAEHEHAHFEYERLREMESRQLASRSAMEDARRTYRVTQARVNDLRVALEQATRDLARTQIVAPFDGVVRSEAVDIGQFVQRGSVVAKIYATDYVEVRLPIADRQLAYLALPFSLRRGLLPEELRPKVVLSADYAGETYTWQGEIVRTEAEIDRRSRMVHVIARVKNLSDGIPLQVGLYVEASIEGVQAEDVIILPRNALRNSNQVLIIDNENRLRFREVEPLRLYRDEVLIKAGLVSGERVCVSVIQTAFEGMLVEPVNEEPRARVI
ncbi:MAG: efflux RND transporter periplasmic adaptor subunit, partial [Proteobacteria bacterium]|nr:efflux RND transporter periplasmic adaptor subunit [Pseudomonadota bacterium]